MFSSALGSIWLGMATWVGPADEPSAAPPSSVEETRPAEVVSAPEVSPAPEEGTSIPEDLLDGEDADASPDEGTAAPLQPETTAEPVDLPPTVPSAPKPERARGTRIFMSGGKPGELELFRIDERAGDRKAGTIGGIPYVRVCVDACAYPIEIDPGDEFFVAGAAVMPSRSFMLDELGSEVHLSVRPGPRRIRFAGFGLTVAGAILVPGGALLAAGVGGGPGIKAGGYAVIGVGRGRARHRDRPSPARPDPRRCRRRGPVVDLGAHASSSRQDPPLTAATTVPPYGIGHGRARARSRPRRRPCREHACFRGLLGRWAQQDSNL
jgi:hypothetical protein